MGGGGQWEGRGGGAQNAQRTTIYGKISITKVTLGVPWMLQRAP